MATLYISEFAAMPRDHEHNPIPAGELIPVASQTVTFSTSTQSATLNSKTRFVRLHTDAICSFKAGANPTATTSDARMNANQTEYFAIRQQDAEAGIKIAVVSNT